MARKGTGLAVAVGAAIAIGAVVAFAATSSKKKKKGLEDVDFDADEDEDEDTGEPVSPVVPGQTGFQTPPFFPPDLFGGAKTTTASTTTPPVAPPVPTTTPATPATPVVLPDEDEDEDEETEATSPTIDIPGIGPVSLPTPGSTIDLPGGGQVTIPGVEPDTPAAIPPPPTTSVEQPSVVKQDTANLVALMLGEEATPNWKRKYPELGAWQAARGLKVDQLFGPASAQRLAQEIGTIPIIRFWPKGTTRGTALEPYRNALLTLAGSAEEPRKAQLIMSANREQGQAFASPIVPVKTLVKIGQAA